MPTQDQSLSILLVYPKIILCRICEKCEPDFFAPVRDWKKAFRAEKFSHLPSLPQFRKNRSVSACKKRFQKVIYTLACFHSISLFVFHALQAL